MKILEIKHEKVCNIYFNMRYYCNENPQIKVIYKFFLLVFDFKIT